MLPLWQQNYSATTRRQQCCKSFVMVQHCRVSGGRLTAMTNKHMPCCSLLNLVLSASEPTNQPDIVFNPTRSSPPQLFICNCQLLLPKNRVCQRVLVAVANCIFITCTILDPRWKYAFVHYCFLECSPLCTSLTSAFKQTQCWQYPVVLMVSNGSTRYCYSNKPFSPRVAGVT